MLMGITIAFTCVQLIVYAGQIFGNEVKWKTLSGLMMLPLPARRILYRKVAGCLIALGPSAAWFSSARA